MESESEEEELRKVRTALILSRSGQAAVSEVFYVNCVMLLPYIDIEIFIYNNNCNFLLSKFY